MEATVWMVHAYTGARQGVRGLLSLDRDHLRFTPDPGQRGGEVVIPLDRVGTVSQAFQSPVLEVEVPSRDPSRMLFYFTEPPFMYGKGTLVTLAVADGLLHEAISGWVEAIRAASL